MEQLQDNNDKTIHSYKRMADTLPLGAIKLTPIQIGMKYNKT